MWTCPSPFPCRSKLTLIPLYLLLSLHKELNTTKITNISMLEYVFICLHVFVFLGKVCSAQHTLLILVVYWALFLHQIGHPAAYAHVMCIYIRSRKNGFNLCIFQQSFFKIVDFIHKLCSASYIIHVYFVKDLQEKETEWEKCYH